MARLVKDPELRRREIIDTAEELFIKNGYELTAISDIVKKVGVAQGTFYHYFKSKDDVLNAITDHYVDHIKNGVEAVTFNKDINAVEKILDLFRFFTDFADDRKKLLEYIHEEKNAHLHLKFEKKVPPMMIPLLCQIIEQGVKKDLFNTRYSEIASVSILATMGAISHWMHDRIENTSQMQETMNAIFENFERILGAEPGIFMKYRMKIEGIK